MSKEISTNNAPTILLFIAFNALSIIRCYSAPPPPPSINKANGGYLTPISQPQSTDFDKYVAKEIDLSGTINLATNFTGGVNILPSSSDPVLNLNGALLTVDFRGIQVSHSMWSRITGAGAITSNQNFLEIGLNVNTAEDIGGRRYLYGLEINSVIKDSKNRVGLRVGGSDHPKEAIVYLAGNQSNTFTGNVEVSGRSNYLVLAKTGGATAVRGDISVSNGAVLRFDKSQQVLYSTNVSLNRATLYYSGHEELSTRFHNLTITDSGVVSFGSQGTHADKRYLIIDDLIINRNGRLEINEWATGRDFILVRKDSEHLNDALSKVHFRGWLPGRTHLEDYDKDYWQISGTPEPSTYGAIFAGAGIGLVVWRRRRNLRR